MTIAYQRKLIILILLLLSGCRPAVQPGHTAIPTKR